MGKRGMHFDKERVIGVGLSATFSELRVLRACILMRIIGVVNEKTTLLIGIRALELEGSFIFGFVMGMFHMLADSGYQC